MSERDKLGKLLFTLPVSDRAADTAPEIMVLCDEAAEAILDAGYRKPRTIATAEELDGAILAAFEDAQHLVLSDRRGRPWIIWADEDDDAWVDSWPQEDDPERLRLSDIALPATVLHEGTQL